MERLDQTYVTHRGVTFEVIIEPDFDRQPSDYDSEIYGEDLEAWKNDDWRFVHISVAPVVDGVRVDDVAMGLGGVEWGFAATFSATTESIGRRAADEGWCDEVMENLRTKVSEREKAVAALNAQLDTYAAALSTYEITRSETA